MEPFKSHPRHSQYPTKATNPTMARLAEAVYVRPQRLQRSKHHIPATKLVWLTICLIGLGIHSFFVTVHYMQYETSTETTIGMPTKVDPPTTSICFSLWDMIQKETLPKSSKCLVNRSRREIMDCEQELMTYTIEEIMENKTRSPLNLVSVVSIRNPPGNPTSWVNSNDIAYLYAEDYLREFYKGPYRCLRFNSLETTDNDQASHQFKLERMTSGYPKARYFLQVALAVNANITPDISTARFFLTENGTYPRGSVTLPVVANLSRAMTYTISYKRIETQYLQSPYSSHCIDYSGFKKIESREHCIEKCVSAKTISQLDNRVPFDQVIFRQENGHWEFESFKFVGQSTRVVAEMVEQCDDECPVDCFTRTLYTTLSESSSDTSELHVTTRFEEPETIVRYIPKFDLQAYIIYEAGVFSIWFSASIFHSITDIYYFCKKLTNYIKDLMPKKSKRRRRLHVY